MKRGLDGVYRRSEAHLPRYLAEFDLYNERGASDGWRTVSPLAGAEGKRLKYRETRPS